MKSKRLSLIAIGILFMSETSAANSGKKLLLETSKGQVEIVFFRNVVFGDSCSRCGESVVFAIRSKMPVVMFLVGDSRRFYVLVAPATILEGFSVVRGKKLG